MHINFHAHRLAALQHAIKLLLVFSNHAHSRNVVISVEAHRAGMREVHACRHRSALPTNHRHCVRLVRFLEEVAENRKGIFVGLFGRITFLDDQKHLVGPVAGVLFHLVVEVINVHWHELGFD